MATAGSGSPASVKVDPVPSSEKKTAPPAVSPTAAAPPPAPRPPQNLAEHLFVESFAYDFFQAVRLLERLDPERKPVGRFVPPRTEIVRFRAHRSLSFPPSPIYELQRPSDSDSLPIPVMTVAFLGLHGPSGALPRHYTEMLLRHEKENKGPERYALRDWLDLFNHRLISLFYRAWEKYRFYIPYERGEHSLLEPDTFTRCLFSVIGLGAPPLRNRLQVSLREGQDEERQERVLAKVNDLALLHYSGFLAHRPRCAVGLEALLRDYFELPVGIKQFHGQWFQLEPANQSRLADGLCNNQMGVNLVAGDRVWDVQGKLRIRLGPLRYAQFTEFLPSRTPVPQRKTFFLLVHLTRLYLGPELDFDVQLILRAQDVPRCQLAQGEGFSPQLGWNTWLMSQPLARDSEDAVFEGEEVRWLN